MAFDAKNSLSQFWEKFALDLSVFDPSFLAKIVQTQMNFSNCEHIDDYLKYIQQIPQELNILQDQLSNSHSEFFRNPLTFSLLEQIIFPGLVRGLKNSKSHEIRIWSAGCAAGQEPYSLAIILNQLKEASPESFNFRIFATDQLKSQLEMAEKGIYEFNSVKNIRLELAEKYFSKLENSFILNAKLKELVDFSEYDLLNEDTKVPASSIYGDFDLVLCCNVLFYYSNSVQKEILAKFQKSLKPGGIMVTGEAEFSILNSQNGFKQYIPNSSIFIKC